MAGRSGDFDHWRLMKPGVIANDEPGDREAAFVSYDGTNRRGVSGKDKRALDESRFLGVQQHIERSIRCIGLRIVTPACAVSQIKDDISLSLRNAPCAAGEPQVDDVPDVVGLRRFVDGGDGGAPIIEALGFTKFHRAAR